MQTGPDLLLGDYVEMLRRRRPIVVYAALLGVVIGLFIAQATPTRYEAHADLLLRYVDPPFRSSAGQTDDHTRAMQDEAAAMTSSTVEDRIDPSVLKGTSARARVAGHNDIIRVFVTSSNAKRAAAAANAYVEAYTQYRDQQGTDLYDGIERAFINKIDELRKEMADLDAQIANAAPADRGRVASELADDRGRVAGLIAAFEQRQDQVDVDRSAAGLGPELLDRASVPSSPYQPRPLRSALAGGVLGLLLGIGLAALLEWRTAAVKTARQAQRAVNGEPVLGVVPVVARGDDQAGVALAANPAYQALRIASSRLRPDRTARIVQVTSAREDEGARSVAVGLAASYAMSGYRTVLIDAGASIEPLLGLRGVAGMAEVLRGTALTLDVLQPAPTIERLQILPSGSWDETGSDAFGGRAGASIMQTLSSSAEVLVVATAPLLSSTTALSVAARSDATLIVAALHRTAAEDLSAAAGTLSQIGSGALAVVLVEPDDAGDDRGATRTAVPEPVGATAAR